MQLTVIRIPSDEPSENIRLNEILAVVLREIEFCLIDRIEDANDLCNERLLFAVSIGAFGVNPGYSRLLYMLRSRPELLENCVSAILIDGKSELYTKSTAAELAFAVNRAGSTLIGRPLVEGTGSLANFRVQAKLLGTDLSGAYQAAARDLVERLIRFDFPVRERPSLLTLHASSYRTSNTMQLWSGVKDRLGDDFEIKEMGLRNGAVSDCSGCPYTMCVHFGEKGRCFYGGLMQDEVWPAVLKADALLMVCPNYNDALSANLTAFINRLTGLFRQTRFYDKALFAIVVSGYSGGDIVARQLISALNMNKSFYLPPRFAMLETANDPGEAMALPGVRSRLDAFAENIRKIKE